MRYWLLPYMVTDIIGWVLTATIYGHWYYRVGTDCYNIWSLMVWMGYWLLPYMVSDIINGVLTVTIYGHWWYRWGIDCYHIWSLMVSVNLTIYGHWWHTNPQQNESLTGAYSFACFNSSINITSTDLPCFQSSTSVLLPPDVTLMLPVPCPSQVIHTVPVMRGIMAMGSSVSQLIHANTTMVDAIHLRRSVSFYLLEM